MSNIFKNNSRFSVLAEEASTFKELKKNNNNKISEDRFKIEQDNHNGEGNSFKRNFDRPQPNYNNGYQRNSITDKEYIEVRALKENLEKEKLEKERLANALCLDNFPALDKKENQTEKETNKNSFLAKLQNPIQHKKSINEDELKPGWISIRRDKRTGIITTEYGKTDIYEEIEKKQAYDVLEALCDLHERRTNEYIELYGYDTWEKTFKSPNWREEEEYAAQMEEEYEAQMNGEYEEQMNGEYEAQMNGEYEDDRYWERY